MTGPAGDPPTAVERALEHLGRLAEIDGAPGHEDDVAAYVAGTLASVAEVRTDTHGNLLVRRDAERPGPTVVIAAHLDEVALVVTGIEDDGFLRISALGSTVGELVAGRVVRLAGRYGVVGAVAGHYRSAERPMPSDPLRAGEAYVDVGAGSAQAVRDAGIDVGTPVTLWNPLRRFGVDRSMIVGKALDDRIGCALLLTLLEREAPAAGRLVAAFTVQEEVGYRGAGAAAHALRVEGPIDLAVAVDTIACADTPGSSVRGAAPHRLGGGPVLAMATGSRGTGLILQPRVAELFAAVARDAGVALQRVVFEGGDNDATAMAWAGAGAPAGSLSIPRRYAHSAVEVADVDDLVAAYAWLRALLARMAAWPPTWGAGAVRSFVAPAAEGAKR